MWLVIHNLRHQILLILESGHQNRLEGNGQRNINRYCSFLCIRMLAVPCNPWNLYPHMGRVGIPLGIVYHTRSGMGTSHHCHLQLAIYTLLLVCIHFHVRRLGIKLHLLVHGTILDSCGRKKDVLHVLKRYLVRLCLALPFLDRKYRFCL